MLKKLKIGVLGGGQLGMMLIEAAKSSQLSNNLELNILEPNPEASARNLADNFTCGDFQDFETVYEFGKDQDVVTIEIEKVNVESLEKLEREGIKVIPSSQVIKIIQDKGLQKEFLAKENIPTAKFQLCDSALPKNLKLPIIQKVRKGGYDGYGVKLIKTIGELEEAFSEPSILEEAIEIKKELSIIVARNEAGEISTFDLVEMQMDPNLNLVDLLFAPANVPEEINVQANQLAHTIAEKLNLVGILAIELFLDMNNKLLVNEMAPRPHNSGHHTIEACKTSQYLQLLNCLANQPLGSTSSQFKAVMINILGEENYSGLAKYTGLEATTDPEVSIHLYNKAETRPGRKMGHLTVIGEDLASTLKKAKMAASTIKVIS